jgi:hypothetical protein
LRKGIVIVLTNLISTVIYQWNFQNNPLGRFPFTLSISSVYLFSLYCPFRAEGRQCFAEGLSPTIVSAIADLPLWADGKGKNGSIVATVGENPSAKGRLVPNVPFVLNIKLIQYQNSYEGLTELESIINQPAQPFGEGIAYRLVPNVPFVPNIPNVPLS